MANRPGQLENTINHWQAYAMALERDIKKLKERPDCKCKELKAELSGLQNEHVTLKEERNQLIETYEKEKERLENKSEKEKRSLVADRNKVLEKAKKVERELDDLKQGRLTLKKQRESLQEELKEAQEAADRRKVRLGEVAAIIQEALNAWQEEDWEQLWRKLKEVKELE